MKVLDPIQTIHSNTLSALQSGGFKIYKPPKKLVTPYDVKHDVNLYLLKTSFISRNESHLSWKIKLLLLNITELNEITNLNLKFFTKIKVSKTVSIGSRCSIWH